MGVSRFDKAETCEGNVLRWSVAERSTGDCFFPVPRPRRQNVVSKLKRCGFCEVCVCVGASVQGRTGPGM